MRARSMLVPAACAALLLVVPALHAQGGGFERPATVNGLSITPDDIAYTMQLMAEQSQASSIEELARDARRTIAEEILLANEAQRRGVMLGDRELDDYWERRRGAVPDYEAIAEATGTSIARQKELARRAALAELYVLHRVGLRGEFGRQLAPDPNLARLVDITPSELRSAYAANKDQLATPARIVCDVHFAASVEAAQALRATLAAGGIPEGSEPLRRAFPLDQLDAGAPPPVAAFLRRSGVGSLEIFEEEAGGPAVVMAVVAREAAREASFRESQEVLLGMLRTDMLIEARRHLVVLLSQQATYWPGDLFLRSQAPVGGSVANPTGRP